MAKSNNFSVYLLKPGYNAYNALKEEHNLKIVKEENTNLPLNGVMYYGQNKIRAPWWKEYWGINQELYQSSVGAIVFLPVEDRCFAITFGMSYHNLQDQSYEYDFGLRTTLNTLDPEKIKSTDLLIPESSKRERIQISNASSLTFFDFNADESIVKRLTGAVKEEYRDFLRNATGSSNLKFTTSCDPNELIALCSKLLTIYKKRDYEISFPNLQNISPIKDPTIISELDQYLLEAYNNNDINLTLGIPDIVDYSTNFKIRYHCSHKRSKEFEDVFIGNYREFLNQSQINIEDISTFSKHSLHILDENGNKRESYTIYRSFLFDCKHNGKSYHLNDGSWFQFNDNFIDKLKNELDPLFIDNHDILCDCNKKREDEYNSYVCDSSPKDSILYCLDKKSIAPQGQSAIEPCDLIILRENVAELVHNKISTRSASLSHLFNQGVNSVTILRQNPESKDKLKELINHDSGFNNQIDNNQYCVTYGIISNKDRRLKSDSLPIFSRMSLLRCARTLSLMNIKIKVFLIKDNVNRKQLD